MPKIKNDYTLWSLLWRVGVGCLLTYGLTEVFPILKTEQLPAWVMVGYLLTSGVISLTTRE